LGLRNFAKWVKDLVLQYINQKGMSAIYEDSECQQCQINEYDNSIVYKIVCNDPDIKEIYVGSTSKPAKRFNNHISDCNNPKVKQYNYNVYKFFRDHGGIANWHEVIIEYVECSNKGELHMRERYWKNKLNASLNTIEAFLTPDEVIYKHLQCCKLYKIANKETINEQNRLYKIANKETIKEYKRLYYLSQKLKNVDNDTNKDL